MDTTHIHNTHAISRSGVFIDALSYSTPFHRIHLFVCRAGTFLLTNATYSILKLYKFGGNSCNEKKMLKDSNIIKMFSLWLMAFWLDSELCESPPHPYTNTVSKLNQHHEILPYILRGLLTRTRNMCGHGKKQLNKFIWRVYTFNL